MVTQQYVDPDSMNPETALKVNHDPDTDDQNMNLYFFW